MEGVGTSGPLSRDAFVAYGIAVLVGWCLGSGVVMFMWLVGMLP